MHAADGPPSDATRDQVKDETYGRERDHKPHEPARRRRRSGKNELVPRHHNPGIPAMSAAWASTESQCHGNCPGNTPHRVRAPRFASGQRDLKGNDTYRNGRMEEHCRTSTFHLAIHPFRPTESNPIHGNQGGFALHDDTVSPN